MVSCIQTILLYVCLGALGLLAAGSFAAFACRQLAPAVERLRKTGRINTVLALLAVAALVAYGGSKPDSCTITFDANGGTCEVASMTVVKGTAIGDLPVPVRDGYDFNGWFTTLDGGTFITRNSVMSEDATYYAHWTATLSIGGGGSFSLARQYSCEAVEEAFFSVSCSRQWSVSVDVPWISFSAAGTSGGDGKVKYSLEENTGASQRVGKITVKSGSLTCVCKITQDKPLLIGGKTSMSRSYSVDAQADCYFTVTCSQSPWTAKSSASWLTVKTASGTGTTKLYYDVAANTSAGRMATITVTSRGLSRVCTVKQDGETIDATTLKIGGKESLSRQYSCEALSDAYFSIASDGSWMVTSDSSWIKFSPLSGVGDGKVTYSLLENTGTSQRVGKITVKSGSLTRTCKITQDKPLLIGGKTSMLRTYSADSQADCYFTVTCSQSPWTAKSSASWLTVKTASGTGTTKLYYDVAANMSTANRTATITVTSRGLSRVCTITQKGASAAAAPRGLAALRMRGESGLPAGLYTGVLADGTGAFSLLLDEAVEGEVRTAYLCVFAEGGDTTAECEVAETDGALLLMTEDGESYALDLSSGVLRR